MALVVVGVTVFWVCFSTTNQSTNRLVIVSRGSSIGIVGGSIIVIIEIAISLPRGLDDLFDAPIVFAFVLLIQARRL